MGTPDRVPRPLRPLPSGTVVIDDEFWTPKRETRRAVTVRHCFDHFEQHGALANFERGRG